MPLTTQHQMNILSDILNNHLTDQSGSVSECRQLQRLIQSLIAKEETTAQVKDLLYEIYDYSQKGANIKNLTQHIQDNQSSITQWVDELPTQDQLH
ncbi:YtzH-like family protein [Bacillus solimangrovi]|uniref:YtzH-like protein n=1 Tax=Bacillus solimangrovi TaxID=1305675 RepID=A0A1E5LCF3_9BACI|nr:YtzH-like family protein [Bacillus solimangrovi]OEH91774.1 hypothetical protein BFG57_03265 [Bacillus solimangrovi]